MTNFSFDNKKILITGASGFIGHSLVASLLSSNCSIIRTSRQIDKLLPLSGVAEIIDRELDYTDALVWNELINGVDVIFYLAAQTSSHEANNHPAEDLQNNVLPLLNLLEACSNTGVQPIIAFASTATAVGLTETLPVAEGICENPVTIYDIHKLCCEKYLSYYTQNQVVKACTLRLANVYGPGVESNSADRGILNMMIQKALNNEDLTIFGKGEQIRDYTYIDDVVSAFHALVVNIEKTKGAYFNIGSGKGHTFTDAFEVIASLVSNKLNQQIRIRHVESPAKLSLIETRSYVADTRKFSSLTGWKAEVDINQGISQTMEEYLRSSSN